MSGQADGSVIVDTELNSEGFKAGSAELLAAIKSLSNEVKTLGKVLKDTFSSNQGVTATDSKVQALEATITSLRAEVQSLKTQLSELQEKFDNLGGAKTAETPIDGIAESAQKADGEVAELQARIKELEGTISGLQSQFAEALEDPMDVRFDTSAAEAQISSLESRIEELEAKLQQAQMGTAGSATPTGANVNLNTAAGTRSSFERQIESVNSSVERLELNFQRAMSGSESSITAFNTKADALESKIASLRQQLDKLGQVKIPTDQYKALESTVTRLEGKLGQLVNRQDKMSAMGVSESSKQWRSLQYEIDETIRKLSVANGQMSVLRGSGQAYTIGADTAQYQHLSSVLSQASSRLAEMRTALSGTSGPITKLASGARSVFQWIAKAAATLGGKFMSGVSKAVAGMKKLASSERGLRRPLSSLTSSVLRLGPALLMARGMMGILRKAVSAYIAENEKLSSTLSACWSGIGNLLGPIISRVISLVATAVAYITKFLSLLGFVGSSTKKAISGAGGAAEKETEKLHRQLASFDELNILQREEDTSGGGGGVEEAELPDVTLPDWVEQMVEQLKAGNWAEAATILTDELNRMVDSVDWAGLGDKLAYGLNGALTFLATAITTFDWYRLGEGIGEFLNSVIHGVDWANLGIVLGWKFIALIEGLGGLFATLDWRGLGKALSDCFMGLWNAIDWELAAKTLSDGLIGVLNALSSALAGLDWQQVARDIVTFISSIDYSGILVALGEALAAALVGLSTLLFELIAAAWREVMDWWKQVAYEDGHFTIEGLLQGILDALGDIFSWIWTNIAEPIINAFKTAFGIASPSTVMMEIGDFLVQGLLLGIQTAWESLITWLSEAFLRITETVTLWATNTKMQFDLWVADVKTTLTTWAANTKQTVTDWVANTKTSIATWASETKASVSAWASDVKSKISSCASNIYSTISSKVSQIRSTVASGFAAAKNTMVSNMQSAMATIKSQNWYSVGSAICNGIANGIKAGWNWLKNLVSSVARSLLSAAKSALGIHSPSRLFRDQIGLNIGYGVGEGIEASEGSVLDSVCAVADAIADEFRSNQYQIDGVISNAEIDNTMNGFADKVADSFATLMDRMQAIAESISFKAPEVSLGTVVPVSVPAAVAASDTDSAAEALQEKIDIAMEDFIQSNIAGHEATVAVLREILEAVLGIEIGDDVIGKAAARYNRRMNFVKGGSSG